MEVGGGGGWVWGGRCAREINAMPESTQVEVAEDWLDIGNSWELERKEIAYPISFYGHVDEAGKYHPGQVIDAVAFDTPVPGFKTDNCVTLRLWNATAKSILFDLASFNAGDHFRAVTEQVEIEKINAVLYPGDDSEEGKILRLKQQFMLCSATLQVDTTRDFLFCLSVFHTY